MTCFGTLPLLHTYYAVDDVFGVVSWPGVHGSELLGEGAKAGTELIACEVDSLICISEALDDAIVEVVCHVDYRPLGVDILAVSVALRSPIEMFDSYPTADCCGLAAARLLRLGYGPKPALVTGVTAVDPVTGVM